MEFWIQVIINGLMSGLVYALVASGLTLVMGITRIINFAHGEFYMLGAFGVYWLYTVFGINYFVALLMTIIILGALGWIVQRGLYQRVQASFLRISVVAIGLMIFIPTVTQLTFGEESRAVGTIVPGIVNIFGATTSLERLVVIGVSIVIGLMLWYLVQRTKAGLAMRAVAEDREAATLQGVNVNQMSSLSMFVGSGLAAAAGGLLAPLFHVSPFLGPAVLFKAFIVVILGGIGTITGAVAAGLLLGFVETASYAFLSGWTEMIGFVAVLIILVFRPTGLLGKALED